MGVLGLGSASLPWSIQKGGYAGPSQDYPEGVLLGRVVEEVANLRAKPDVDSPKVAEIQGDKVYPWLREVIGVNPNGISQRWVETPEGYIWSPLLQPVWNQPNLPVKELPSSSLGNGMWAEVTVPLADVVLENSTARMPFTIYQIDTFGTPRVYYSQVFWVDQIRTDENGDVWYHFYNIGWAVDTFWGPAWAFRPISQEELSPITPNVENKRIDVNLARQTVSAFEDDREVYFCRASTGRNGSETSPGKDFRIKRKAITSNLSGQNSGAEWDLAGIGYLTMFTGSGISFHSTFWHNNFGERTSGGCVNLRPEDAKWIFRWTSPQVGYDPGDIDFHGSEESYFGTVIRVLEA